MAGQTTLGCDEFLDLAAGVALDAADAEEVRRVEEHAAACPRCRAWLDEFRRAAGALGLWTRQMEPPPALRTRLMKSVGREARSLPLMRRLWPRPLSLNRPRPSPAWLVAAASFIVAVMSLAWVAMLQGQISDLRNAELVASERAGRFDRVVGVLASQKLSVKPLEPVAAQMPSTGYAFLDPDSGTGMLMCHNLPPVEQGHAYQIWFVRGNDRVSGGMLWPDRAGDGYTIIHVPQDLQSFDSIGLTDEPGSGSAWPTTARVMGAALN